MKRLFISLLFLSIISCAEKHVEFENYYFNPNLVNNTSAFLDTLQYRSFLYFIHEMNPENGLVKDRSTDWSPASIAATGFAIPIWAIGVERDWITREKAVELTLTTLRFFWNSEQSDTPGATGYKGFYYHFLDLQSGKRTWESELSTVDTGWLLAGMIFARQYYKQDNAPESEIRSLVDSLISRLQWDWTTLQNKDKFYQSMSLGWKPESGFIPVGWVGFNEALSLYILAAGSGYQGVQTAYQRWLSFYDWRNPYPGIELLSFPPMFGHHYSHMFIDLRNLPDPYMFEKGLDYFQNGQRVVEAQRRYAIDNPLKWIGYDSLTWGLTACDGPGAKYNSGNRKFQDYSARGTSGDWTENDDGTIAPTAAAASIVYNPNSVIPTLLNIYKKYGQKGLWGKYGFKDSFNPTANWIAADYLGIDQGPIVLMLENWRNGFVWKYMMKDPVVQKGLSVLGFQKTAEYPFEEDIQEFEKKDKTDPPPQDAVLFIGGSGIRMWKSLQKDMAPLKVINRGFGGSQAEHVLHFFDRVVEPYKPKAILFYEGENDIAEGKLPVEILVHFKEFCRMVDKKLAGTTVYFISIKPSYAHEKVWLKMQITNALIKEFCENRQNTFYIDTASAMLNDKGEIRNDIYIDGMLHMNAKGYKIWTDIVKKELENILDKF